MIVYHGSNCVVEKPDVNFSRSSTDFSKGFYLTPIKEQALMWCAKKKIQHGRAFINGYELNEGEFSKYKLLYFDSYSLEWLKFICKCRYELDTSDYDIVFGPIADDKIYDSLNLYFSGFINEFETINKIKFNKPNMKICIRNNRTINDLLIFKNSEEI